MTDTSFLIIDTFKNRRGEDIAEVKEYQGKIMVKHFMGVNTDNYILSKQNGLSIQFSMFRINGIYFVNLNGCHIIDYRQFSQGLQKMSENKDTCEILLRNRYFGEIVLRKCDLELMHKAIHMMRDWMKGKTSFIKNFLYYLSM
jgi:hypothetical protein